jgi:hypothetical protein
MSPGCVGCQPSSSRVSSLEAGQSAARKWASQVKCSPASSGEMETTGNVKLTPDHLGDVYAFAHQVGQKYRADLRSFDGDNQHRVVVTIHPVRVTAVDMAAGR